VRRMVAAAIDRQWPPSAPGRATWSSVATNGPSELRLLRTASSLHPIIRLFRVDVAKEANILLYKTPLRSGTWRRRACGRATDGGKATGSREIAAEQRTARAWMPETCAQAEQGSRSAGVRAMQGVPAVTWRAYVPAGATRKTNDATSGPVTLCRKSPRPMGFEQDGRRRPTGLRPGASWTPIPPGRGPTIESREVRAGQGDRCHAFFGPFREHGDALPLQLRVCALPGPTTAMRWTSWLTRPIS